MKRIVVRVLLGLLGVVVLGVIAVVVKFYVLAPQYRAAPDVKAPSSPEAVARGKYLAHHVSLCISCHSELDESKPGDAYLEGRIGSGRDFGPMLGFPGRARTHNLTPDEETGVGKWTDGEILRAMREGVGKDGHALFPLMPYNTYRETLTDDDALAIIAYLRTLPAIKNDPGKAEIDFPVSMFIRDVPKPLEKSPPAPPPASDKLAYGNWLLKLALCNECHDTTTETGEPVPGMSLAGGYKFPLPDDRYAIAPNITSDKATGIGAYSDEDIRRVLTEGKGKDGRTLYVMPWFYFQGMTETDIDALIMALRQVPAVANVVPPSKTK